MINKNNLYYRMYQKMIININNYQKINNNFKQKK